MKRVYYSILSFQIKKKLCIFIQEQSCFAISMCLLSYMHGTKNDDLHYDKNVHSQLPLQFDSNGQQFAIFFLY